MDLSKFHAASHSELEKYMSVDYYDGFSVAEYINQPDKKPLFAFTHKHDHYEFVMPLETIPVIKSETSNYIGEVGYCYPVNPHVVHGIEFDLTSRVISIVVHKKIIDKIKERTNNKNQSFYSRFMVSKELYVMVRKFQEECQKPYPNNLILQYLSKNLGDILVIDGLKSKDDLRKPKKAYGKNVKKVLVYMFENYENPDITIPTLAKVSGYSIAYFTRAFKAFMGDSPITYLNKLRLSEAKALFMDESLSLKEIAKIVGYKNLSTFTESFKKNIGMKPKAYRNKYFF